MGLELNGNIARSTKRRIRPWEYFLSPIVYREEFIILLFVALLLLFAIGRIAAIAIDVAVLDSQYFNAIRLLKSP